LIQAKSRRFAGRSAKRQLRRRKDSATGTSEFPICEAPWGCQRRLTRFLLPRPDFPSWRLRPIFDGLWRARPPRTTHSRCRRLAEPFESFRDCFLIRPPAHRTRARRNLPLANLGPLPTSHTARATYAKNVFEPAHRGRNYDGFCQPEELLSLVQCSGASLVCRCVIGRVLLPRMRPPPPRIREAGANTILAGRPENWNRWLIGLRRWAHSSMRAADPLLVATLTGRRTKS